MYIIIAIQQEVAVIIKRDEIMSITEVNQNFSSAVKRAEKNANFMFESPESLSRKNTRNYLRVYTLVNKIRLRTR